MKPYKIGIALSGGGARGIAHIGVLKVLEQYGIFPDCIAGTSAGAIVGALYANGISPDAMLAQVKTISLHQAAKMRKPRGGLLHVDFIKDILLKNIPHDDFLPLQKKLFICVTNGNTGETEFFERGALSQAVMASSAIPVIFNPIHINNITYIDGGMTNNLPTNVLRDICEVVIAVDVVPMIEVENAQLVTLKDMALRTFELAVWQNTQHALPYCDIVIAVKTVRKFNILSFANADDIYKLGCEAAMARIDAIKDVAK